MPVVASPQFLAKASLDRPLKEASGPRISFPRVQALGSGGHHLVSESVTAAEGTLGRRLSFSRRRGGLRQFLGSLG